MEAFTREVTEPRSIQPMHAMHWRENDWLDNRF